MRLCGLLSCSLCCLDGAWKGYRCHLGCSRMGLQGAPGGGAGRGEGCLLGVTWLFNAHYMGCGFLEHSVHGHTVSLWLANACRMKLWSTINEALWSSQLFLVLLGGHGRAITVTWAAAEWVSRAPWGKGGCLWVSCLASGFTKIWMGALVCPTSLLVVSL